MNSINIFELKKKIESSDNADNLGLRLQLANSLYEIMVADRVKFWQESQRKAETDVNEKFFHVAKEIFSKNQNSSSDKNIINILQTINDHIFPYDSNGKPIQILNSIDYVSIKGFENELSSFLGGKKNNALFNYKTYELFKIVLIMVLGMIGYASMYFGIQGPLSGLTVIISMPLILIFTYRKIDIFLTRMLFKKYKFF